MSAWIRKNLMDDEVFKDLYEGSHVLRQFYAQNVTLIDDLDLLLQNTFFLLYKVHVRFEPSHLFSFTPLLLKSLSEEAGMLKIRDRTKGSSFETYLVLKFVLDDVFNKLRGTNHVDAFKKDLEKHHQNHLNQLMDIIPSYLLYRPEEMAMIKKHILPEALSDFIAADVFTKALKQALMKADRPFSDKKKDTNENALSHLLKQLEENPSQEKTNESLEKAIGHAIEKESQVDEAYAEAIKRDLENRLMPFIKNYLLAQSNQMVSEASGISPLASESPVDAYRMTQGEPIKGITPLLEAYESDVNALKKNISKTFKLEESLSGLPPKIDALTQSAHTLGIQKERLNALTFDEAIALYKRLNDPKFLRFVNKVGKNKRHAQKIVAKNKSAKIAPIDKVAFSNKIDDLIDSEWLRFALDIEAFDNDFYDRYLRDALMTIKMVAKKSKHRGPIVLCYDGSGSMQGVKIEETKAHVLAIIEIAKLQKRPLVLIQFASKQEPLYIKHINPLYLSASDVFEIIDTFICGGTDFEKPLEEAMAFIAASKFKNADILFITDGQCNIRESFKNNFMALKKARRFKLFTVIIHPYTYGEYGDIGDISDEVLEIKAMDMGNWNDETNSKLFALL